jgi:hypothetical protein
METCPRHDECQHGDKFKLTAEGRCADCGTQLAPIGVPGLRLTMPRSPVGQHRFVKVGGNRWEVGRPRETTPDLWDELGFV